MELGLKTSPEGIVLLVICLVFGVMLAIVCLALLWIFAGL